MGTILKSTDVDGIPSCGVLTLDCDITSEDAQNLEDYVSDEFVYLYLGRQGRNQLGLLLCRLAGGTFVRRGHLSIEDSIQHLWGGPLAHRMEISLG